MKLTRRAMAQILAVGAAASKTATAQTDASAPAKAAREQFERNAQAMASVKVPMTTEPPFHFKA